MTIKSKVLRTLVDKKKFTRKDIYRAIYKAQGIKKIPNKFPNGFYGTNICEWKYDGLITPIEKGVYIMGNNADLYLNDIKEYRRRKNGKSENKLFPYQQQEWEIKLNRARELNWEKANKQREMLNKIEREREEKYIQRGVKKFSKLLVGKTISNVRYLSRSECADMGWYKSPLVIEFDDKTCIVPQMDDEGNDGGALLYNDYKSQEQDTIYTI